MPLRYRFLILDHRNHVASFDDGSFESDAVAGERAIAMYRGRALHAVEVWESGRFVCRVNDLGVRFAPSAK